MQSLSAEQSAMQAAVRQYAAERVLPGAADRDASGAFPGDLVTGLAALDCMGISVAEEFGGLGLDTVTQLLAVEEVAYADAALASIYTAHYLGLEVLVQYGSAAQQRKYLTPMARGEMLAAFALTEPDAGSDIGSMRSVAERRDGGWVLRGTKTFISNAQEAGALLMFAKTEPSAGIRGISAFVVPRDADGLRFSTPQAKCGLVSAPTYTVYLDEVEVADDAMVGEPGQGAHIALLVLNAARIDVAAMANGIARRALDLAVGYANQRRQFGRRLFDFQAIQLLLGEMDALVEAARLTAFSAAQRKDAGGDIRRVASIAKWTATENCFRAVDHAVQIHGGAGFMRESEIERLYRDCRVLRIYEGTSQIQLLTIAKSLDRRDTRD